MPHRLKLMEKKIPLKSIHNSTGTLAVVTNSGKPYLSHTVASETTRLSIPLDVVRASGEEGVEIVSVKIPYRHSTGSATVSAPVAALYRQNMAAVAGGGTDISASSLTVTTDATTLMAATDQLLTVTNGSTGLDYDSINKAAYVCEVDFACNDSSVLRIYEPIVVYKVAT